MQIPGVALPGKARVSSSGSPISRSSERQINGCRSGIGRNLCVRSRTPPYPRLGGLRSTKFVDMARALQHPGLAHSNPARWIGNTPLCLPLPMPPPRLVGYNHNQPNFVCHHVYAPSSYISKPLRPWVALLVCACHTTSYSSFVLYVHFFLCRRLIHR